MKILVRSSKLSFKQTNKGEKIEDAEKEGRREVAKEKTRDFNIDSHSLTNG